MIYKTGKIVIVVDGLGWRWAKRHSTNGTNCTSHQWFPSFRDCEAAAIEVARAYQITYGGME